MTLMTRHTDKNIAEEYVGIWVWLAYADVDLGRDLVT